MISADLEPLNFKDRLARRRLWTRSVHETLAERDDDGAVVPRHIVPPKRPNKARAAVVRFLPFWDGIAESELDEALLKLAKLAKGRR